MYLASVFAFVIGLLTVLQSGLNKKVSFTVGLPAAIVLNSVIILVISLVFYFGQKQGWIPFPEQLKSTSLLGFNKWWLFVPALCGFFIVMGFPYTISFVGAAQVFVIAIAGQCVGSLLWDAYIEHNTINMIKVGGVFLTLLGAYITSFK
ncbi:MAG: DMT family transporter [Bdellovibrionota bacterium]